MRDERLYLGGPHTRPAGMPQTRFVDIRNRYEQESDDTETPVITGIGEVEQVITKVV